MRKWLIFLVGALALSMVVGYLAGAGRRGAESTDRATEQDRATEPGESPSVAVPAKATGAEMVNSLYRNTQPQVRYVGDSACAECHEAICGTYHQHPMGRSAVVAGSDTLEQYGPEGSNPFRVGPYELEVIRNPEGNGSMHRISAVLSDGSTLPPLEFPIQIAIGSGTRGRSYLSVEGDCVWQSPISWYSTSQRLDVSPGFDLGFAVQRPIVSECLYCHVQQHDAIADTVNRYREPVGTTQWAIGCERCHGPGQLHVDEQREGTWKDFARGEIDTSIVNPAHLSEPLQMSICAQCHLSGKERVVRRGRREGEFRPGLPFEQFATAFLAHPDAPFRNAAVSHFDQSALAKCRTANGNALLCTSCHDPHQSPESDRVELFYNRQCIDCHVDRGCSATAELRQAKNDSCVACHMPKSSSSNIPHTSLTDHRIRRDPNMQEAKGTFSVSDIPLMIYAREGLEEPEIDRDLGIALSRFAGRQAPTSAFRKEALEKSRAKLKESLQRWPDDTDAWLALSETEKWSGNAAAALAAAQDGLKRSPKSEKLLAQVANLADAANEPQLTLDTLSQLVAQVPGSHDYLARRMLAGVVLGRWDQAEADCRELLRIHPLYPMAHLVLGMSLHGDGQKAEARREVNIALELATNPTQRASIQSWFDRFVAWRAKIGE